MSGHRLLEPARKKASPEDDGTAPDEPDAGKDSSSPA
jgi:hypothetical protein